MPIPIIHPWLCERSSTSPIRLWHRQATGLGVLLGGLCRNPVFNPELRRGPTHRTVTWSWQCLAAPCLRRTFHASIYWQLPRRRDGALSPPHPTDYLGRCNPAHTLHCPYAARTVGSDRGNLSHIAWHLWKIGRGSSSDSLANKNHQSRTHSVRYIPAEPCGTPMSSGLRSISSGALVWLIPARRP
jgi:hypothetical protein